MAVARALALAVRVLAGRGLALLLMVGAPLRAALLPGRSGGTYPRRAGGRRAVTGWGRFRCAVGVFAAPV
ncbi:hypothetical protein GCM10009663_29210 [Kitasatospora arboriphila]|uniref:Uncharacterized protein n=1 Tax=Kitasatospora arboriphila TaxID=258052 RepID=A0ABN1TH09_9ACTN